MKSSEPGVVAGIAPREIGDRLALGYLALVTILGTITTILWNLERYDEFQTGWSWDLAYYNQWFWCLTHGLTEFTIRPIASYATEGPSIWKMNYLAPVRFLIAPFYRLWPDPRCLLIIHDIVLWGTVPAAFTLAKSESKSNRVACATVLPTLFTPLFLPLVLNDFRELQMALPFVLLAVDGVRGRAWGKAAWGILGMLACRQEFGLAVALLAFVPARESEPTAQTRRWMKRLAAIGLIWFFWVFFGVLKFTVGPSAPRLFMQEFAGVKAPLDQTLRTSLEFIGLGLGCWAIFALWAPRVAVLALPWVWSLAGGRWSLRYLSTEQWHHVRYCAPYVAFGLAAGVIGWSRLFLALDRIKIKRHRWGPAAAVYVLALVCNATALGLMTTRLRAIPSPIENENPAVIRHWVAQVAPDDGVLTAYEVAAPLSSRRIVYGYRLEPNRPRGFPKLGPEFRWVFVRVQDFSPEVFTKQGFQLVHDGPFLRIFRREPPSI